MMRLVRSNSVSRSPETQRPRAAAPSTLPHFPLQHLTAVHPRPNPIKAQPLKISLVDDVVQLPRVAP